MTPAETTRPVVPRDLSRAETGARRHSGSAGDGPASDGKTDGQEADAPPHGHAPSSRDDEIGRLDDRTAQRTGTAAHSGWRHGAPAAESADGRPRREQSHVRRGRRSVPRRPAALHRRPVSPDKYHSLHAQGGLGPLVAFRKADFLEVRSTSPCSTGRGLGRRANFNTFSKQQFTGLATNSADGGNRVQTSFNWPDNRLPVSSPNHFQSSWQPRLDSDPDIQAPEWITQFVADIPSAVALFDRELRYVAANNRWLNAFGLVGDSLVVARP